MIIPNIFRDYTEYFSGLYRIFFGIIPNIFWDYTEYFLGFGLFEVTTFIFECDHFVNKK